MVHESVHNNDIYSHRGALVHEHFHFVSMRFDGASTLLRDGSMLQLWVKAASRMLSYCFKCFPRIINDVLRMFQICIRFDS